MKTDGLDEGGAGFRDTIGDLVTKRRDGAVILAGRYKIVRKLGEGGMGSVWLAEDQKLDGRKVAIKMLPVVLATNARAIQQLKAEAKVAMQLAHASIITLRSFEDSEEGAFLVLDYVPGKTLEQILVEKGTLSEAEVLKIFKPVAEALDHAHRHKVIHRDIKPSNIIVHENGEPFIMDFGIAREMKDTMTRVTGKNSSGTLPYMSPEQLRGEDPTPAQDVYSLAATIYECLSGHPPFHRGQIEYQIANEAPKPLAANTPLARAVMAGLAKTPKGRPATATELVTGQAPQLRNTRIARKGNGWKWAAGVVLAAVLSAVGISILNNQYSTSKDQGMDGRAGAPRRPGSVVGGGGDPAAAVVGPGADRTKAEPPPGQRPGLQEEAPRVTESQPPQPAVDYEALVDLKAKAEQRWERVQALDPGQGFGEAKDPIGAQMKAALDCFNDEKRHSLALKKYETVVTECERLLALDGERQAAVQMRDKAMQAQSNAKDAGAEAEAGILWNNAWLLMQEAEKIFKGGQDFPSSGSRWSAAAKKYAEAATQAQTARTAREAEAKKKANAEAKAAEEAAAKKAAEEAVRKPDAGDVKRVDLGNGVRLDLAWIPAGSFTMGIPAGEEDIASNEGPQHRVTIAKGFWMGEAEVTQAQYEQVMKTNPSNWKGANLPVESVSWNDAKEFCQKASQILGRDVRLPSEAEWEYACRAGTTTAFHYGDSLDATMANFDGSLPYGGGQEGENRQRTTPVKSFRPNAWGLYDMHGNVSEYCEDRYHDSYSGAPNDGSPWLSPAGIRRIVRGGCWLFDGWSSRSAARLGSSPGDSLNISGFRVVMSR